MLPSTRQSSCRRISVVTLALSVFLTPASHADEHDLARWLSFRSGSYAVDELLPQQPIVSVRMSADNSEDVKKLTRLEHLQELELYPIRGPDIALRELARLKNLKKLALSNYHPAAGLVLAKDLACLKRLESVGLEMVTRDIVEELERLPKLRELSVRQISSEELSELGRLKHLEILRLDYLTDAACLGPLRRLKSLKKLCIDVDNSPTEQIGAEVCAALARLDNLESIELSVRQLTVRWLKKLARIDKLHVLGNTNSVTFRAEDIDELCRLPGLHELRLTGTLTDRHLQQLARLKSLRGLSLRWGNSDVTDQGFAALAELKQLTYLDVQGGSKITSAGLEPLTRLPHLESLNTTWLRKSDRKEVDYADLRKLGLLHLDAYITGANQRRPRNPDEVADTGIGVGAGVGFLAVMHRHHAVEIRLHAVRQRLVRGIHRGEQRVAALRRAGLDVEDAAHRRFRIAGNVAVPAFAVGTRRILVGMDDHQFRMVWIDDGAAG